ncbi:MAG: hypothetical protein RIT45_2810, partial [Pseudomonadota bacterium]
EHGAAPGTARAVATHQGEALVVRWSPAREGFVSGGADGHVRRVGHAGDAVQTLGKHEDAVASMASDPTGALVVTGSLDGSVGLWPAEGSARMLRGHDGWVTAVAVSDDGTLVASGSNDESVRLWRADGVFLNRIGEHDYGISALRFAPGEARLLTVSLDGSAAIFGADAKRQARLTGHEQPLLDGVWSPDGRQVATASEDARTRIWASRPSALASIPGGACEVGRVEILPGGMAALAWGEGDLFDPCPAGPTRLWERAEHVGEDRPPRRLPAPEQPIRGLVAVDASAAVAVYEGGRAERLDHEGRSQGVIPGDWQLVAADDAGFALASAEGALARFDAQGHARGRTTAHGPVRRLVACGGGAAVLHADGSATWLDDAGHEARLPAQANAAAWIACATRPNGGAWVVRGDEAGAVRVDVVGDSAAAGAGATVEHAHAGALVGVAVLPAQGERPALVVSAGRDGHVRFARLEAPAQASASVEVPGGAIAAMAPDVRGGRVLVLGGDGVARLYDAAGALVCALRSPDGEATGIALSRDGGVAALVVRGTGATLVPVDREALLALADARSSRRLRPAEREAVGLAPEPDAAGETETAAPQHTR